MNLSNGEGGLNTKILPGPSKIQQWAQKLFIIIQLRGCNFTLKLSFDLDLILHAMVDSQFVMSSGVLILMHKSL